MRKYLAIAAIAALSACAYTPAPQTSQTTVTAARVFRYDSYGTVRLKNNLTEPVQLVSFGKVFAKPLLVARPGLDSTVVITKDDLIPEQDGVLVLGFHTLRTNKFFTSDPMLIPEGTEVTLILNDPIETSILSTSSGKTGSQGRELPYGFHRVYPR
jgi:hypothetical protein